jgi:Mn2+/Fe2+ NRAMP family transporter
MVFYQQSAVVDKGLRPADLRAARWDTAIGAAVTQFVMVAALVAVAATIGASRTADSAGLNTIGDLAKALTPFLGNGFGKIVFSAGILGAAMISSIVVSLAAAWGIGEVSGYSHSLEHKPLEAPWFYGIYTLCILVGAVLVAVVPDLVSLNLGVEVMNALLLPLVLGFLVALALKALPEQHRPRGVYLCIVLLVTLLTTGFGVYGGLAGAGIF